MKRKITAIILMVALVLALVVPMASVGADINSNLQGYWQFDTDASDSSGNTNDGTLMNGAATTGASATVPGDGASVSLDGVNDYVSVPDNATLDFGTGDFTVAAWIKVSTPLAASTEYGVVNKNTSFQGTPGWGIEVGTWGSGDGDFQVIFYITNQTAWGNTNAAARNASMTSNAWHHIAGVRDGTTTRLYFDGDLVKTKTHADAGGNVDNGQPVIIGDHRWGPNFPGLIDEVRLYASALTEQEIGMLAGEGSVALSPNGVVNPVNTSHMVTAEIDVGGSDVTEAYTVNFEVTSGPNTGDSEEVDTDAAGGIDAADFSYTGDGGGGTDQITAWIDIDLDDQIDSGEPQATVTKDWVVNFITGGGKLNRGTVGLGGKLNKPAYTFAGTVGYLPDMTLVGQFQIVDHTGKGAYTIHLNSFSSLVFTGDPTGSPPSTHNIATFTGSGWDNLGDPVGPITIQIEDNAEPGKGSDRINVVGWFSGPLIIDGGNFQAHDGYTTP